MQRLTQRDVASCSSADGRRAGREVPGPRNRPMPQQCLARASGKPGCYSDLLRSLPEDVTSKAVPGFCSRTYICKGQQSVLQEIVPARIVQITSETPTVKRFKLKVEADFAFCPGQWVDFYVPGLRQVGGYSICSSQKQLLDSRTFDLAVKQSAHAPAAWLHHQASVGAAVGVRVGGCFCLEQRHLMHPLLFLAGGIGITPIAAMVSYAVCKLKSSASQGHHTPHAALLYTIRSREEAALLKDLQQLAAAGQGCFHLDVRITDGLDRRRRLSRTDLQKVLGLLNKGKETGTNEAPITFVSGPKTFEHDMIQHLRDLKLPADHILCEQWQ